MDEDDFGVWVKQELHWSSKNQN